MSSIKVPNSWRVLQVHSRGCELGKKFSAFNAKIYYQGRLTSIEEIYQTSKSFDGKSLPTTKAKGKQPTGVFISGKEYEVGYLTPFYYYLRAIYYLKNEDLVKMASEYSDFEDIFKGKSVNNQEDTLRTWIRDRPNYLKTISKLVGIVNEEDIK